MRSSRGPGFEAANLKKSTLPRAPNVYTIQVTSYFDALPDVNATEQDLDKPAFNRNRLRAEKLIGCRVLEKLVWVR